MREEEGRADAGGPQPGSKRNFWQPFRTELRTPLNSILGWSQLSRSGKPDEERRLARWDDRTQYQALAQIIDDLLDVSRIISGKLRLDVRRLELEPVVAFLRCWIRSDRPAERRSIDLQYSSTRRG